MQQLDKVNLEIFNNYRPKIKQVKVTCTIIFYM